MMIRSDVPRGHLRVPSRYDRHHENRRRIEANILAFLPLLTAAVLTLCDVHPTAAQQARPDGPITPDSAQILRERLVRPPAKSPIRAGDVIAAPFEIVGFTIGLVFDGVAELLGLASRLQDYEPITRPYRTLVDAGVRPGLTTDLGPRSGLALSVLYDGLSPLAVESAVSIRGSLLQRVSVEGGHDAWSGRLSAGFERHEEEHFWGIGLETPTTARSDFRHDRIAAEGVLSLEPRPWLTLSSGVGVERTQVGRGGDDRRTDLQDAFDPTALFGAAENTRYGFYGFSATLDATSWHELQERGVRVGTGIRRYEGIDGTPSAFTLWESNLEALLPVTTRHTLALAARTELRRDSGRGVPFTHLASLGGGRALRAFEWGRFRDRDLLAMVAEWRYEIWRDLRERGRVEAYTFWEEGGVARTLGDLTGTRRSYGFGMLLAWNRVTAGRWWIAHGDEGTRFSASLSATLGGLELTP